MASSRRTRRLLQQQSLRRHRMKLERLEKRYALNAAPVLDASASPQLDVVVEDTGVPVGQVGTLVSSLIDSGAPDNALEFPASVLPGTTTGNLPSGYETSGLTWHDGLQKLFAVSDESIVSMMNADGTELVNWSVPGDLEALTVADHTSSKIYIGVEHPDSILEFDVSTGQVTRTFELTSWMTGADSKGLEALAFVPDAMHPEGGIFYAGLQDDGRIYQFSLPIATSSSSTTVNFIQSMSIEGGSTDLAGLAYEPSSGQLLAMFDRIDQLNVIDRDGQLRSRWTVPGAGQEAVVFIDGHLYVGDDTLRSITRYSGFDALINTGGTHNNFSDIDGDLPGIAITGTNLQGGTLYYSIDDGMTWAELGAVSENSARVLYADGDTRLAFTPAADFNGSISDVVILKAWDRTGGHDNADLHHFSHEDDTPLEFSTATDTVSITVDPANDVGAFSGDTTGSGSEDAGSLTGTLTFTDAIDGASAPNYTLIAEASNGTASIDASTGAWTYAPETHFNGSDSFTVTVTDDDGHTETQVISLTVDPANDAGSFSGDTSGSGAEDSSLTGTLTFTDTIDGDTAITFTASSDASDGTASIDASTGAWTYAPETHFNGSDSFTVTVTDDDGHEETQVISLMVNSVNDDPMLDALSDVNINEDDLEQTVNLTGITAGGSETQVLSVTAVSDNTGLIPDPTVDFDGQSSTGTLKFTPVADQSGTATITVTVEDGGLDNDLGTPEDNGIVNRTVTVITEAVNDEPTLDALSDVNITEDAPEQTVSLTGITAGGGETQVLSITAVSDNTGLIPDPTVDFVGQSSTATLKFTPVADQSGTATITVTVEDGGLDNDLGTPEDNGVINRTVFIAVAPTNDAPTLDALSDVTINEDDPEQTVNLTGITAGGSETQVLSVIATSDNTGLIPDPTVDFDGQSSTGTLKFTPVADQSGTATITVTVEDGGLDDDLGTPEDNGVINRTVFIAVAPTNDAPMLDALSDVTINEDAPEQTVNLTGITAGGGETQVLSITAVSDNTGLIPDPTVDFDGQSSTATLKFTPVADQSGTATITVTVEDGGLDDDLGTPEDNGIINRTVFIAVAPTNDEPTLDALSDVNINEDDLEQTVNLTGITAGGSETQLLSITAVSDNTGLIPDPTVDFDGQSSTGTLKFTPVADQFGTATITVTVEDGGLDDDLGTPGDNGVINRTIIVKVDPVNDAPVLDPAASPALDTVNEDVGAPTGVVGTLVSSLIDAGGPLNNFSDVDGDLPGIAITETNLGGGTLYFSTNNGSSWTEVGTVSERSARVLYADSSTRLAYEPFSDSSGVLENLFAFKAWDRQGDFLNGQAGVNTQDRSAIHVVSTYETIDTSYGLTVSPDGQYAYVAVEDTGLEIVDIQDPKTPFSVGVGDTQNYAQSVALSADGNHAYVSDYFYGITIFNVQNPLLPSFVSQQNLSGISKDVQVSPDGRYAYVAAFDTLKVVAVQFPASPSVTGTYQGEEINAVELSADGETAFISDYNRGFEVLDIRNPALPTRIASRLPAGKTRDLALSPDGKYAYVAQSEYGVKIFDVQSPENPIYVGLMPAEGNSFYPWDVTISPDGRFAYVAAHNQTHVFDVTDPSAPHRVAAFAAKNIDGQGAATKIAISHDGQHVFVGVGAPGVQIIDVTSSMPQFSSQTNRVGLVVSARNDPPTLNAVSPVSIGEDDPEQTVNLTGITAGGSETQVLSVIATSDNTGLIPDPTVDFDGQSSIATLKFTPVAEHFGTATITVTVEDGGLDNDLATTEDNGVINRTVVVKAEAVNDEPTLDVLSEININEDDLEQTVNLTGITAGGGESQQLEVTAVSDNTGLIPDPTVDFDGQSSTATLKFTPVADQSGTATITVTVEDGGLDNDLGTPEDNGFINRTVTVITEAVNDEPTLDALSDVNINEDDSEQTVNLTGIAAGGGETQVISVKAISDNTGLIHEPTVDFDGQSSTGTLKFTPVADQSGTATITVTVEDGGLDNNLATSEDNGVINRTVTVITEAVNDEPTLDALSDVNINEDDLEQTVNLTGITAGGSETQLLSITAVSDNTGLIPDPTVDFDGQSSTGILKFTPVADQFGTATITVTVEDGGLDNNLATPEDNGVINRTITVITEAVNDEPTLDVLGGVNINEDDGEQTVNLTGIAAGGSETQVLSVTAVSDNTGLIPDPTVDFDGQSSTATLKFTPVADQSGTATITVTVEDGGFDNDLGTPEDNGTIQRTVIVAVAPVNDTPTLDPVADLVLPENSLTQVLDITGITAGGGENQPLQVTASSSNSSLVLHPTVTSRVALGSDTRLLTVTPLPDQYGIATVIVTVENGGLDLDLNTAEDNATFSKTFDVTITPDTDNPPSPVTPHGRMFIHETLSGDSLVSYQLPAVNVNGEAINGLLNRITPTSSDTALISDPTVLYASADVPSSLSFTPVANANGTATLSIQVEDGGLDNNFATTEDNRQATHQVEVNVLEVISNQGSAILAKDSTEKLYVNTQPVIYHEQQAQSTIAGFAAIGASTENGENALLVQRASVTNRLVTDDAWRINGLFDSLQNESSPVLDLSAREVSSTLNVVAISGAYGINGVNNPTLIVRRGQTYTFTLNTAAHPFYLQTTGNGYQSANTYSGGFTGNGQTNGEHEWIVAEDAPDEIFYQCEFHPVMFGKIIVID